MKILSPSAIDRKFFLYVFFKKSFFFLNYLLSIFRKKSRTDINHRFDLL